MEPESDTTAEAQSSKPPATEPTDTLSATKTDETTEKPQPRRSTRISSASKPVADEAKAPKKSAAPKKRTAEEVDATEKKEENDPAVKKVCSLFFITVKIDPQTGLRHEARKRKSRMNLTKA